MVYFNCNACGETLKRNKVESHYLTKCRACEVLSCVDCSKEFWGDDYKSHMTCVSEQEKYSGSNYVAKPNKGEVKQEQWQKSIHEAVEKNKHNTRLKDLLWKLSDHPNIPRKRAKFENFTKSTFRIYDSNLVNEVWEIISKNHSNENKATPNSNNTNGKAENGSENHATNDKDEQSETKLNKREKKEQRKLQNDKKEKKDKDKTSKENIVENKESKKKKKKDKQKGSEEDQEIVEETNSSKRKRKIEEVNSDEENCKDDEDNEEDDDGEDELPSKKRKIRFDWEAIILTVLKTKGDDIPIKKLRKKVLMEYVSLNGNQMSDNELSAKFHKKLNKNPKFKVLKDRVKLVKNK